VNISRIFYEKCKKNVFGKQAGLSLTFCGDLPIIIKRNRIVEEL